MEKKHFAPPAWGPYSKKYMGVSHIPRQSAVPGARFDCTVFPTLNSSGVPAPNVTVPAQYHPWECTPDYAYFAYRYDLEWKDVVYADVSFSKAGEDCVVIRTQFVNRSDLDQNCLINYFCAMEYPFPQVTECRAGTGCAIVDATDYADYSYHTPRPWDRLNPDAAKKGVFQDPRFTGGWGLGERVSLFPAHEGVRFGPFGAEAGDRVSYRFTLEAPCGGAVLGVRFGRPLFREDKRAVFTARGLAEGEIVFEMGEGMGLALLPVGDLAAGEHRLELTSLGEGGVELDCLFLAARGEEPVFVTRPLEHRPQVAEREGASLYRYAEVADRYGIRSLSQVVRHRDIPTGCLEDAPISRLSNSDPTYDNVTATFSRSFARKHSDEGFFHNTIATDLFVPAGQVRTEYALLFRGEAAPELTAEQCEAAYLAARARCAPPDYAWAGKPYELSNRILHATLLQNAVYPIFVHGEPKVHYTPGKRWDSLYTWDSGFIGLGMLEAAPALAEYILDLYLAEEDNPDYAYVQHGSPVPVQLFLYYELFGRTANKAALEKYYPRARRMYRFLAGKAEGSTTASHFQSGLTTTYDYFYNCSGMDDYPPQVLTHRLHLAGRVAPALPASMLIRCARMLAAVAAYYGREEDLAAYRTDIERLSGALQRFAWDEESGYFGYVLHDEAGEPVGILRTETGENANKGLDGTYPLMAGICTPGQRERLLGHLKSERELMSRVGLSAVDQSSGYFQPNGYWNGNVWFPHQWFYFKTMLDLGERDFAFRIAKTALEAWRREVDHSYYTFEFLNIATGRGGWFHHFGGLSAPINIWAAAYFAPGHVTCGFDFLVESRTFAPDLSGCSVTLRRAGGDTEAAMIVTLRQDAAVSRVRCGEAALPFAVRVPGTVEVALPADFAGGTVVIE